MDQTTSTLSANTLHCALELSKNSWLLAIQFPDREQPSLYSMEGGDTEKLMAKLTTARDSWAKVSGSPPAITVCYEVGYDAFWLARFLKARGIECLVIDPGSVQVNRRGRRVKTDRVDVKMLLRTLIAWCRGERHVYINRIKGLLFGQGIRDRTGGPEACHGAGADCQDRARARHGADTLRGDRAQASSPAPTEEHWAGDLSLAFA
jgi:hypothetical protein